MTAAIPRSAARRYALWRQGLYGQAFHRTPPSSVMSAVEWSQSVQVDPINAVARNHDLVLYNRLPGYQPPDLAAALFDRGELFEYGGLHMIYPRGDLPAMAAVMLRRRGQHADWTARISDALTVVRTRVASGGEICARDFAGRERMGSGWKSTSKDTSVALQVMSACGELVISRRTTTDRYYRLFADFAGGSCEDVALEIDVAEDRLFRKALADWAPQTVFDWSWRASDYVGRRVHQSEGRNWLRAAVTSGLAAEVKVEGCDDTWYLPVGDAAVLQQFCSGSDAGCGGRALFLAPLDNLVRNRRRMSRLFGFEYLWEVYVPAAERRFGYYTLPVLWDDSIVARAALRTDRAAATLAVEGFYLEDGVTADDAVRAGIRASLRDLTAFVGAAKTTVTGPTPPGLKRALQVSA